MLDSESDQLSGERGMNLLQDGSVLIRDESSQWDSP